MKRIMTLMLLIVSLASNAQVEQNPSVAGRQENNFTVRKSFKFPTLCGSPQGVPFPAGADSSRAALAFDSCNNRIWVYNPANNLWDTLKVGASGLPTMQQVFDKQSKRALLSNADTVDIGVYGNYYFPAYRSALEYIRVGFNDNDFSTYIRSENYLETILRMQGKDYGWVKGWIHNSYDNTDTAISHVGYGSASSGFHISNAYGGIGQIYLGYPGNAFINDGLQIGNISGVGGTRIFATGTNAPIMFSSSNTNSGEYARFLKTGEFGIGTQTPDSSITTTKGLHVQRGVRFPNLLFGPGTYSVRIGSDGTLYKGDTTWDGGGSGGVTSVDLEYGITGSSDPITTTGTIIADTSVLVNKSGQQILPGNKTFTGTTTISSPSNAFRMTMGINDAGTFIVDPNVDPIIRRSNVNIWTWTSSALNILSGKGFNVDANTFLVDPTNNRVAINSATASHELTVNGQVRINSIDADNVMDTTVGMVGGKLVARAEPLEYTALITQTTTDPPGAEVLRNTTGVTFTWGYTSAGEYTLTADSGAPFIVDRTMVFVSPGVTTTLNKSYVNYTHTSTTVITFRSLDGAGSFVDDSMERTSLKILIYP